MHSSGHVGLLTKKAGFIVDDEKCWFYFYDMEYHLQNVVKNVSLYTFHRPSYLPWCRGI